MIYLVVAHLFRPSDIDIPPGWASVIVAVLVGGVGGIGGLGTFMNRRLRRMQEDVATTKNQVSNEHVDEHGNPINLREEQDERHAEVMRALHHVQAKQVEHGNHIDALEHGLDSIRADIGGIRSDVRQLHRDDASQLDLIHKNIERMTDIESTIPRDSHGRFMKRNEE